MRPGAAHDYPFKCILSLITTVIGDIFSSMKVADEPFALLNKRNKDRLDIHPNLRSTNRTGPISISFSTNKASHSPVDFVPPLIRKNCRKNCRAKNRSEKGDPPGYRRRHSKNISDIDTEKNTFIIQTF